MNPIANYSFIHKPLRLAVVLLSSVFVTACSGGAIHFDVGNSAEVSVDENTTGVIWKSVALVDAAGNIKGIVYKLSGADAALFSLNSTSGELAFKQPADFEAPLDADNDNEYEVKIEASYGGRHADQYVHIKVKDITKPIINLIKPRMNENVGNGDIIEVETQVRFYDAESNTSPKGSDITLNGSPLIQDATHPHLWAGKIAVPEGGIDLSISGSLSNGKKIKSAAKLFNNRNGINASFLKLAPGGLLYAFGSEFGFAELDLNQNTFFYVGALDYIDWGDESIFIGRDFNSQGSTLIMDLSSKGSIGGIAFRNNLIFSPEHLLPYPGHQLGSVISVFTDNANEQVISVSKTNQLGADRYHLFTQPINTTSSGSVRPLWDLPADAVRGKFKFLNIHGSSKTYIVADERVQDGRSHTIIQGFGEDGVKRFEAIIGPDISNLVVDEAAGVVYVAENHSSALGKIKSISVESGEVKNVIGTPTELGLGAYSTLHLDAKNGKLYIGDNVSDSIFVLDLASNKINALHFSKISAPSNFTLNFAYWN